MLERRLEDRRTVDIILNVYQDGFPVLARARNLSVNGIRLHRIICPRCRRHEPMDLEFQLPNDPEVFFARGKCVYEAEQGAVVGIRFMDVSARLRRKVRKYLRGGQRQPDPN